MSECLPPWRCSGLSEAAPVAGLAQVSFVNSICTVKGGTHVDYIVNQISKCAPGVITRPARPGQQHTQARARIRL